MIKPYDQGEPVRCSIAFRNAAAALADPTAVTFRFTTPAGAQTTYTHGVDVQLVKDSTGNYHVDLTASEAGHWFYRWQGTGVVALVEPGQFIVQGSAQA